jgi:hypothetical protein
MYVLELDLELLEGRKFGHGGKNFVFVFIQGKRSLPKSTSSICTTVQNMGV